MANNGDNPQGSERNRENARERNRTESRDESTGEGKTRKGIILLVTFRT